MAKKRDHSHFEQLKNKWVVRHQALARNVFEKHQDTKEFLLKHYRKFAAGTLGGLMAFSTASTALPADQSLLGNEKEFRGVDKSSFIIHDLYGKVPQDVRPLTTDEEERITAILSERFGFHVTAELEGKRLNRNYGYIGKEQHLKIFPGDSMQTHFDSQQESIHFGREGMAPGLGAWGYFSGSRQEFSEKDKEREKYYIAVQTFLSKDFNTRFAEYRDFFKFRKMLLVNPNNGRAVVTVVGDAGPAAWTGKHLGGSPEVMSYLERVDGSQKGPVLYFFIDDPDDTIPLGPVEVK